MHPPRGGIDAKKHFGVKKGVLGNNKKNGWVKLGGCCKMAEVKILIEGYAREEGDSEVASCTATLIKDNNLT